MNNPEKQDTVLKVKCPTCQQPTVWQGNTFRPFCSERCKMIDLGNWAGGKYNIESVDPPDFPDDGTGGISS
ncbi:MAG: DNA gyrase inhibitor YacG [SAR324 cluster bacterium]|nr:DNA gyrase inhibitor YacG [SAR324 cluster bacterium]